MSKAPAYDLHTEMRRREGDESRKENVLLEMKIVWLKSNINVNAMQRPSTYIYMYVCLYACLYNPILTVSNKRRL